MLGVGCWMRVDSKSELYVELLNAVPASGPLATASGPLAVLDHLPSVFVLIGGSVALLSFLGCCGACADSACFLCLVSNNLLEMWANAQRDCRPVEYR